ncbi:MAG: hypothetical protein ACI9H9_000322 [Pseudoalteromonas tetraodonis]
MRLFSGIIEQFNIRRFGCYKPPKWCSISCYIFYEGIMEVSYKSFDDLSRKYIDAEKTLNDIAPLLIDEWVPYFDCIKCGRNDYCKYTKKRLFYPDLFEEVKCGVVSSFITGISSLSNDDYNKLSTGHKEKFLDVLYYLTQYCIDSESFIGSFQIANFIPDLYDGTIGANLIGMVSETRGNLDKACSIMQEIDFLSSKRIMLLVEGESELEFVKRLKAHSSFHLDKVEVKSYGGESSKKYSVIRLLMNEFKSKGYKVIIQVDVDGNPNKLNEMNLWGMKDHVSNNLLEKNDIFAFSYDLEEAYPKELLYESLIEFGHNEDKVRKALTNPQSTKNTLYKRLNEDLGRLPSKLELAKSIADLVSSYDLVFDKNFKGNELIRFYEFISNHSMKI